MDQFDGIRLGGIKAKSQNWWEECNLEDEEVSEQEEEQEMKYLEHHGVLFPPFYKRHGIPLVYEGKKVELTEEQEELCTYWCQTIGTPWEEKEIYRKNFQTLMQTKFEEFELGKCDFTLIRQYLE